LYRWPPAGAVASLLVFVFSSGPANQIQKRRPEASGTKGCLKNRSGQAEPTKATSGSPTPNFSLESALS
jgi:hypothetical protein